MKVYLLLLLLVSISCYSQWWQNSNVPDLTTQNFFDVVGKDKWVFVKFYTTWCGYCRKMSPEFDKLFDMITQSRSDILVRRLEGDSNEDITYAYDIHSFPKLVLYKPGSVNIYAIYQGYRIADEMFKFLNAYAPQVVEPVKEEVIKIAAVEDKKKVEDKPKATEEKPKVVVNNTQSDKTAKRNNTRKNSTATVSKTTNNTNVEEFKNNTHIEIPIVENTATISETLINKIPENIEIKEEPKKEEVQLRQTATKAIVTPEPIQTNQPTEVKKNEYDEKDLQEIKFLKDEVKFLSEKLISMQSEIQIMKSLPSSNLKPYDFVIFGVVLMVIVAVILTIKKIYNKLKVS
jgi:thiol-disulfide isomerase/thioredoxin